MDSMKLVSTPLPGLRVLQSSRSSDSRGSFSRIFCDSEFMPLGCGLVWRQANISTTRQRGTVRGLHFQRVPHAETKMIRCLRGSVFDVAVDLRPSSPTYLAWHAEVLTEKNDLQMLIPEGFAHGFQSLEDEVQLLYFHSVPWHRESEAGVRFDDPALAIDWPMKASNISERDAELPAATDALTGVVL